jgi:uncharacterized protein (TIGR02598 family)
MVTYSTKPKFRRSPRAFSLVELAIAVGIVTYSMLAILGVLSVGLRTMNDSSTQYGTTTIAQQIISELQLMPFSSSSNSSYSIATIGGRQDYYTIEGAKTDNRMDSYFTVTFATNSPAIPGGTSSYGSSAQIVTATLIYPTQAPQQTNVLSFLTAKQNGF